MPRCRQLTRELKLWVEKFVRLQAQCDRAPAGGGRGGQQGGRGAGAGRGGGGRQGAHDQEDE